jgi:hypothetical protein
MPRTDKIITPKGQRYPGSGRVKGTPNKISVELKTLVNELVHDVAYQHQLRQDFRKRRVHPAIETLIWNHSIGKPAETIALTAAVSVNGRIEDERRAFALLDVAHMEELAAESQRLVDRAMTLAQLRTGRPQPPDIVVEALPDKGHAETLGKRAESDNGSSVNWSVYPKPDEQREQQAGDNHEQYQQVTGDEDEHPDDLPEQGPKST